MAGHSKTWMLAIAACYKSGHWNFLQIGNLGGGAQRLSFATGM